MKNKKVLLALIAVVVFLAGISLAIFTGPKQTDNLSEVFTSQAVPAVEEYLTKLTKQTMKVTFRSKDFQDGKLILQQVAARPAKGSGPGLEMDQVVFTRLEPVFGQRPHWLVSGEITGLRGGLAAGAVLKAGRMEFEELRLHPGLALVTLKHGRAVGFIRGVSTGQVYIEDLAVKRLMLTKGGRLDISSGQAAGVDFRQGKDGIKLGGFKVVGASIRDLKKPSPFDAGLIEIAGFEALKMGKAFLRLAEASLKYDRPPNKHNLDLRLIDLALTADGSPHGLAAWMAALGYSRVTAALTLKAEVNLNSQTLKVDQFKLTSPQMGELDLGLELGGFRIDPSKLPQMSLFTALLAQRSVSLVGAGLEYRDASLAGRLLAERARAHNLTTEQMRQRLIADLERVAGLLGPGFESLRQALTAFIKSPKVLKVRLVPVRPLGLLGITLMKPTELVERLAIEAQAD